MEVLLVLQVKTPFFIRSELKRKGSIKREGINQACLILTVRREPKSHVTLQAGGRKATEESKCRLLNILNTTDTETADC